jgi:hypothetical protein
MNSLPAIAAPGDYYLVDMRELVPMGELVPVVAVSPRLALYMVTGRFGAAEQCPPGTRLVYQLGVDGELLAVYE